MTLIEAAIFTIVLGFLVLFILKLMEKSNMDVPEGAEQVVSDEEAERIATEMENK